VLHQVVGEELQYQQLKFTSIKTKPDVYCSPTPAGKSLPDWYRKMPHSMLGKNKPQNVAENGVIKNKGTIKACMPVLDVLSCGYTLRLPVDLMVRRNKENEYEFLWSADNPLDTWIEHHPIEQVKANFFTSRQLGSSVYKIIYPFMIGTPKGYSCLFLPPVYRDNKIEILQGVVCTDEYPVVNFPFFINTDEDEFILKAETPFAQVIPFRRENWQMSVEEDVENVWIKKLQKLKIKIADRYGSLFRSKVKYR